MSARPIYRLPWPSSHLICRTTKGAESLADEVGLSPHGKRPSSVTDLLYSNWNINKHISNATKAREETKRHYGTRRGGQKYHKKWPVGPYTASPIPVRIILRAAQYGRDEGIGGSFLMLAQKVQSIKEMDLKEMEEALPRLREEAVEAEKALRVAQERVREANGKMAKAPAFVEVHGDHLVVNVKTRDKNFALLSSISIPLEHVVGAEAEPHVEWEVWRGWRVPGVKVPGVRFYAVRGRRDKTLMIWLKDETYERLVTEVEDPAEVAQSINEAVGTLSPS